ncbi:3-dehydroquinate synthase [Wigglesworthia glossinidia endosymbiont of Glossina morsitans morsitans (Yale colony)]|uniref:3-dehydroquinate synthase n=1 Tax=Wigglesworthia glossinidia endosymbiont of Glossina morsitans morsitans (Yale colony) TaxID=1142511 RepID=H6Q4F7_WIGGL|nr:3-dehydroquinate synthase [Wigglesworthia glossinidia]AFA41017.1 3-dehydroquinate synthase [Wigglesworthia glossinidia endosymbiont of Glossina morsitans morsitans (Yale colony)]
MKKISILSQRNNYSIVISKNLFKKKSFFYPLIYTRNIVVITDTNIARLYLKKIKSFFLKLCFKYQHIILSSGEHKKSFNTVKKIISILLKHQCNRNTILIAIGGGVIGDLSGFVASIYQRGIPIIQIPTTLLSQVDSSIGGKTGINHLFGKNMIGSFYHPIAVGIDPTFLYTLPKKEIFSGLSEVIKYGITLNLKFFYWLEKNIKKIINLETKTLQNCIYKCCKLKSEIISKDIYDLKTRMILNFGHTYGHAIENFVGYGNWSHGQAISAGMMISIYLSKYFSNIDNFTIKRIQNILIKAKLPIHGPKNMSPEDYINLIKYDKKQNDIDSGFTEIIIRSIGKSTIKKNIETSFIRSAIQQCHIQN